MEQNKLMESVKQRLKDHLRDKFTWIHEGTSDSRSRLDSVYTRLFITQQAQEFSSIPHEILDHFNVPDQQSPFSEVNYQQIDFLNIFKPGRSNVQQQPAKDKAIQRVLTKGIAGIGKTFTVQNFALNWAEGKSNQHIDFIFVLLFRELNMLRDGDYSLLQLLLCFYPELKPLEGMQQLVNKQVLFIFDGLDENRFPLDFDGSVRMDDMNQRSTVNVLLTNLIKGNLLPGALLWVTSRPAAASQIPSKYIDQMTEVQGFTERQKELYFSKRFSTASQAKEVLSCLRGMISFYFMGHIPIFCWIIAEVFRKGWSDEKSRRITTMTELYIYYLLIQTQRTTQKYAGKSSKKRAKKKKSQAQNSAMLSNLSKLAFDQLQKGNIIFYEEDLRESGINVDEASVFCGFCSEILKEERGLYKKKMFSFVHLSFQEFLAALYMHHCCMTKNINTLKSFLSTDPTDMSFLELQKKVVDKAMQSEKGQLDLFLCFFLGFSLESNQTMLQSLLPQAKSSSDTSEEMKGYLKNFSVENIPQERCMNLFLCKMELKEERFQDDIRMYLNSGVRLSPIDCSVLSTMLQISGEVVEELDLTKSITPFIGTEKLVQQLKNCKKAVLKNGHLSNDCLGVLLSILQSADSCLRELCLVYFSNFNDDFPYDLVAVLGSPDCKLETLRFSGFSLDFRNCHKMVSILQSELSPLKALHLTNCICSYPKDCSGYCTKDMKTNENYVESSDEFPPLTMIPSALIGPICKLEKFSMPGCYLKNKCCQVFASVLSSNSQLRELDLSRNDLQDLGVQLLSVGLGSSRCRLETLRLSRCGITEDGCVSLASALKSNPSHLRELDLSYNHPGVSGVKVLSEQLENPKCRLEELNVDHNEEHWVNPHLLSKYACDLTFDPNTVNKNLLLTEYDRKVSYTQEKQPYPDHPERFDQINQVLCREALTGRCYWEVEWEAFVNIGVAYKSLQRKGHWAIEIDRTNKSWCFNITSSNGYSFRHNLKETFIPVPHIDVQEFPTKTKRLGLFLDWPAGVLSFYLVSDDTKTLIHTFHTTFTEPLYPAFTVYLGSSLTLSSVPKMKMYTAQSSFTPEMRLERTGISYRFTFPGPGLFRCSLTGLVFDVTHESEVTYRTLIWDPMVLQPAHKVAGGPLFSIECSQDSVRQLHLPHCEPEPALVSDSIAVVHITDDGMSIIQPLEITETHVVVDVPHLSAFGIVWDLTARFFNYGTKPIRGQVLLFLRNRPRLILSVMLLPGNVPLHDVKAQHTTSEYIEVPSFCYFHKGQKYSLNSAPQDFKIQPACAEFFENYGPNYHPTFEIILTMSTEEVTLMVQDPEKTQVWEHDLHLPASSSHDSPAGSPPQMGINTSAEKLRRARTNFIDKVSDPVLNKLLDELQHFTVLTDAEGEAARAKPRADKARDLIDTVRKKGAEASSKLIDVFHANDPYLCKELSLM
ncbi:NACHT, LRR and PYD domains-containing protein 3-like [Archocentrus centrarchus]|uniref:NACHT, LRR and PYD domains-containing protein 3-like n=1 Tax=Archocentrus centrarchus TaxID=63155 RepID=UPI0011EA2091|nr:NACHT, LRR and PYD domains-containing protein 3-like [Archocentrus centrarchus]